MISSARPASTVSAVPTTVSAASNTAAPMRSSGRGASGHAAAASGRPASEAARLGERMRISEGACATRLSALSRAVSRTGASAISRAWASACSCARIRASSRAASASKRASSAIRPRASAKGRVSQAVSAASIIERARRGPSMPLRPPLASCQTVRPARIAGSNRAGRPARRWRAAKPAPCGSSISPATRARLSPLSSASAISAKGRRRDRIARRISPAVSCSCTRRCATSRTSCASSASSLSARAAASRASRAARSPRSELIQPALWPKRESCSAIRATREWRTSIGRSVRARSAWRSSAFSPCRSTIRIRAAVPIAASGLRASATREGAPPTSARAAATGFDRSDRPATAARVASQPMATQSTRSASISTGERASTRQAISGWSEARATINGRGA